MNTPERQQAMNKIAAAITSLPTPSVSIQEREADPGLRAALYFAMGKAEKGDLYCHWIVRYVSGAYKSKRAIRRFNASGMTDDEIINEIVLGAVSRITEEGFGTVKLYIEQAALRAKFAEALPLFKNLRLLEKDDTKGRLLSEQTKMLVKDRAATMEIDYERKYDKEAAFKRSGVSTERAVYVDASCAPDSEKIGYGYVIKDVVARKEVVWHLVYGAATTPVRPINGSTGAELKAIRNVLRLSHVIDDNLRNGYRSLTIFSDSLWGIRLINAKLNGETPDTNYEILPHWERLAEEIVEIASAAPHVRFSWVKGHSEDWLNDTADRLAKAARRGLDDGSSHEHRTAVKSGIVSDLVTSLKGAGVSVKATEHNASSQPKSKKRTTTNS